MGKWSLLKAKYPKAPIGDPDYQAKVETVKAALVPLLDVAVKDRFLEALDRKDQLKQELALVNVEIVACEQVFIGRLEGRGQDNVKFADGLTLYLLDKPTFKVTSPALFWGWLHASGDNEAEFPLTVNPQTLASRCKARLEADVPLPEGVEIGWVDTGLGKRGVR